MSRLRISSPLSVVLLAFAIVAVCVVTALGIVYGSAFLVLGGLLVVILLVVALVVPTERLMAVYVVVLVLVPNILQVSIGGFALTATRLLAPAILGVFIIRLLVGAEHVRRSPLDLVLAFFFCMMVVGLFVTMESGDAASRRYATSRMIAFTFEYFTVYYLVYWTVRSAGSRGRLLAVLVSAVTIVAAYGVVEAATHHNILNSINTGLAKEDVVRRIFTRADLTRARSTFEHPISLGTVLAMMLPLALHFTGFARTSGRRTLAWVSLGLMAVALLSTVSRGPYVAAILAMSCVFLFGRSGRTRAKLVVAVSVLSIMAVTLLWPVLVRVFSTFRIDASVNSRLVDYPLIFNIFREHWLIGQGLGTLNPTSFQYVDNYFLKTLGEMGVLGVLALLLMVGFVLLRAFSSGHRQQDAESRSLAVALFASTVAFSFQTATFDSFSFSKSAGVFWVVVALAMSLAVDTTGPAAPEGAAGPG